MDGGKKSLLVNSKDFCKSSSRLGLNIKAQNGKQIKNNKFRLNISSCEEQEEVGRSGARRRHRRGGPNSLRAGAPDALSPHRRLEQPRGAGPDPAGVAAGAGRRRRADRRRQRLRRRHPGGGRWRSRRRPVVRNGRNLGFAAGCNAGAARSERRPAGDPQPRRRAAAGIGEAIRRPWLEDSGWAAWQALVAERGGAGSTRPATRSTSPASSGPAATAGRSPRRPPAGEVTALSGACLAIPRRTWGELGGFPSTSSSTTRTSTSRCGCGCAAELGIEPPRWSTTTTSSAREHKWRWLERNRLAFLVRTYPPPLLVLTCRR